jgi:uncharacterized protein (DUF1330 family)
MNNSAKLIINAIPNKENMQEVQSYLGNMMPIISKHGGKVVQRYKTLEQLTGENGPEMIVIFEFQNAQFIKTMMDGEGFKNLSESRAKAFTKLNMMVCGEM